MSTVCQYQHKRMSLALAPCMLMHLGQNLTHLCIAVIDSDMAAHTTVWHAQITDWEALGDGEWYARTRDMEWVAGVPRIVAEPHIRRICFYVRLPDHVDRFEVFRRWKHYWHQGQIHLVGWFYQNQLGLTWCHYPGFLHGWDLDPPQPQKGPRRFVPWWPEMTLAIKYLWSP